MPCILDVVEADVPSHEINFHVSCYGSLVGWTWDRFQHLIPLDVREKIASICPSSAGDTDLSCWQPSSDGNFTLKSAYKVIASFVNVDACDSYILGMGGSTTY